MKTTGKKIIKEIKNIIKLFKKLENLEDDYRISKNKNIDMAYILDYNIFFIGNLLSKYITEDFKSYNYEIDENEQDNIKDYINNIKYKKVYVKGSTTTLKEFIKYYYNNLK